MVREGQISLTLGSPSPCPLSLGGGEGSYDGSPRVAGERHSKGSLFLGGGEGRGEGGGPSRMVGYGTGHGFTSQISDAYSAMVRSLENGPELAILRMAVRVQPSRSAYRVSSRRSASR